MSVVARVRDLTLVAQSANHGATQWFGVALDHLILRKLGALGQVEVVQLIVFK